MHSNNPGIYVLARDVTEGQIEDSARLRAADISSYLNNTLSPDDRFSFVKEFEANHALRLAVIRARLEQGVCGSELSERAAALLEQMVQSIHHLNSFFPGTRGLEGYEGTKSFTGVRKHHCENAVRAGEELVREGALEDIAYENRWIAEANLAFSEWQDSVFTTNNRGRRSRDRAVESCTVSFLPQNEHGALFPLNLPGISLGDLDVINFGYEDDVPLLSSSSTDMPFRISNLRLGIHTEPASALTITDEFSDPNQVNQLLRQMQQDSDFRHSLAAILARPLHGGAPAYQVAEKLLSAKLLLMDFEQSGPEHRSESLGAVVNSFKQHLPGPLNGPNTKYSTELFAGLTSLLANAANSNDFVWNEIRMPLLLSIEEGHFGARGVAGINEFSNAPQLVDALRHLPRRIKESEWLEALNHLTKCEFSSVVDSALKAIGNLADHYKVPLLISALGHQFSACEPSYADQDPYGDDAQPELTVIEELGRCGRAALLEADLRAFELRSPFTNAANLREFLDRAFWGRPDCSSSMICFFAQDEAYLKLALRIDRQSVSQYAAGILDGWGDRSFDGLSQLVELVSPVMSEELKEHVVRFIGERTAPPNRNPVSIPLEVLDTAMGDWGYTSEKLASLGGAHMRKMAETFRNLVRPYGGRLPRPGRHAEQ